MAKTAFLKKVPLLKPLNDNMITKVGPPPRARQSYTRVFQMDRTGSLGSESHIALGHFQVSQWIPYFHFVARSIHSLVVPLPISPTRPPTHANHVPSKYRRPPR